MTYSDGVSESLDGLFSLSNSTNGHTAGQYRRSSDVSAMGPSPVAESPR